MKKNFIIAGILVLTLVLFLSGCTENNNGSTEAQTYEWTVDQFIDDMPIDMDWSDGVQLLYTTLDDGDTIIITGTINETSYDSTSDKTQLTFTKGSGETTSFSPIFEGNLTDTYSAGDTVKITAKIKHVKGSYSTGGQSIDYEIEIFEKTWTNEEDFFTTGGGALPATSIEKVE